MSELASIARAAIYPSIGIARVGNSPDEYVIGPELPDQVQSPSETFKDAQGALKRQAARFRIYGFDADNKVVAQITTENAGIEWSVHVANTKGAWYNFEGPMDIPSATPVERRNPEFTGKDRDQLRIDPGPRTICGANQSGAEHQFDSGSFLGKQVYLGEIRTDERGRLLFLGGHGVSGTPYVQNTITGYANNRGWFDDVSDGPVRAKVMLGGRKIPVEPAWVVTAPPNYAPDLKSNVTLYEVLFDAYQGYFLDQVQKVSFNQHIWPILRRLCELQWVNFGYFLKFGWGAPFDFTRDDYLRRLASSDPDFNELRLQLLNVCRDPAATTLDISQWPLTYGDNVQIPPKAPGSMLSVTKTQYAMLQKWAAGDFIADWEASPPPGGIESFPLDQQPNLLTRAALEFCSGGPFHPGCELTWPMRHLGLYSEAFRLRVRPEGVPERDYGDVLTPAVAVGENGPFYWSAPGDLTRWMAIPWQTDTAGCRAGYTPSYDPFLPTFWPARVPNHVLTAENYQKFVQATNHEARIKAFDTRATWLRCLDGGIMEQMQQMTREFGKMGVVVRKELNPPPENFPAVLYVEEGIGYAEKPPQKNRTASAVARVSPRKKAMAPTPPDNAAS
jgi:hypothetical protein